MDNHGRADGVVLEEGDVFRAASIVVAAGVFASTLQIQKEGGKGNPPLIFPIKGEAIAFADAGPVLNRVVRARGAYMCPKSNGRLVVGATEIAHDTDATPTDEGVASLKEAAIRAAPQLANEGEVSRWAGLRPATADYAPVLGEDGDHQKLYYALGHYRNGILLAPQTAAVMADLILEGRAAPALSCFSPMRVYGNAPTAAGKRFF